MDGETTLENAPNLSRQRSSRRLRHEAQIKVFERQTGNLEEIRLRLGLRPSQVCELLKVHPSAWTRWTRTGRAPPHVYQMMEWYMELLQWRGQYRSPKDISTLKTINKEDPEIYIPQEETTVVASPKIAPIPRIGWPLIITWLTQALVWVILLGMILKKH